MKQTLKATAAILGIVAAGLVLDFALDVPIHDKTTEALTAITALTAAGLALSLAGYAVKLITSK